MGTLEPLLVDLKNLNADLKGPAKRHITNMAAIRGVQLGRQAASADLGGDPKFSGWAPRLRLGVLNTRRNDAIIYPPRSAAGPWTVAQRGRHQGGVDAFQGPGINRRTGRTSRKKDGNVRKVRSWQERRWNGRTAPKYTADDAVELFERELPRIMAEEVQKVIRRRLGG